MPIELESGTLQLSADEIVLYVPAAALAARVFNERIALHLPMTHSQFTTLYMTYSVVSGNRELMNDINTVVDNEIAKRKRPA
jgi:hypothetical protein